MGYLTLRKTKQAKGDRQQGADEDFLSLRCKR